MFDAYISRTVSCGNSGEGASTFGHPLTQSKHFAGLPFSAAGEIAFNTAD
jgi:hypothetical protein